MRVIAALIFCVGLWQMAFVGRPLATNKASSPGSTRTYLRSSESEAGTGNLHSEASSPRRWGLGFVAALIAAWRFRNQPAKAESFPVQGTEDIMKPKAHGSTDFPVQEALRWNVDRSTADRICSYNRHFAEYAGYWSSTSFLKEASRQGETFYDSISGKALFVAPKGRSWDEFEKESFTHGWPSFRDEEVVWENVRCLPGGECVSVDGTHLGHNIPDRKGNRYCINLVSVAGHAPTL